MALLDEINYLISVISIRESYYRVGNSNGLNSYLFEIKLNYVRQLS